MSTAKIHDLLVQATQKEASDIHLVVNKPPIFRIHGELTTSELSELSAKDLKEMLVEIMNNRQKQIFNDTKELDFAYYCMDDFQFRVNVHVEKGNIAATIRLISTKIQEAKTLGIPSAIEIMARKRKGLIILSGTAGSGKSTTLNYMINLINNERRCKIITIEDPIELVHKSNKSLIIQREVGSDTNSFAAALKFSLRQDPDVVVIGETRDLESISMALTTAETGHLVITTLHAPDAIETINRIIDVYPSGQREQICTQLAENLV
ncbi:MAG: PilT/PilU family type 4a pilus ATPase, partial [Candidatus Omnitrophica bacterium]|nr:PilT/PilU family type 4a pilus ATPase [Candidatus Omnitrophota bacterium]